MKKIFLAILLLTAACQAYAFDWGAGYNNGGPTVRFRWDDTFTSELSVDVAYSNTPGYSSSVNSTTVINIAPLNTVIYKNDYIRLNGGVRLGDIITYVGPYNGGVKETLFSANSYIFSILIPELEVNVPWVKGLVLIGDISAGFQWAYSTATQKPTSFSASINGVTLANVGVIYYFGEGSKPDQSAQKAPQVKAAPVAQPTAVTPRPAAAAIAPAAAKPASGVAKTNDAQQGDEDNTGNAENN
jgi:hypothetical protein